jgi:hypothetical protein
MAYTIAQFRDKVDAWLQDDDDIMSRERRDEAIKSAVDKYGRDKPGETVTDVPGDGGRYYPLTGESAILSPWNVRSSTILSIEYPAADVSADETASNFLSREDWQDNYEAGGVTYLYLPNHAPAASETMRIKHAHPYQWDQSPEEADVPEIDFEAICQLATGYCCEALAIQFSKHSDSTIALDAVQHRSKADEYSRRAKEMIGFYEQHMGLAEDVAVAPASAFAHWPTRPSWHGSRVGDREDN